MVKTKKQKARTAAARKAWATRKAKWLKVGGIVWFLSWQGFPVRCEVERIADKHPAIDGTYECWVYVRFRDPRQANAPSQVSVMKLEKVHRTVSGCWLEMAKREETKAAAILASAQRYRDKAERGDLE